MALRKSYQRPTVYTAVKIVGVALTLEITTKIPSDDFIFVANAVSSTGVQKRLNYVYTKATGLLAVTNGAVDSIATDDVITVMGVFVKA